MFDSLNYFTIWAQSWGPVFN